MTTYETLETRLSEWAAAQTDIRAVVVVGSRARLDADRWSDLDILMLTTDRQRYSSDSSWLSDFGDLVLAYAEPTARGDAEWYAVYEGALKLDVVLLQVDYPALELTALLPLYPYRGVLARGVRVIYDRLGSARTLPPGPIPPIEPPTAADFENVVNGVLMAALTTAEFIARGDLLRAQRWFANDLHPQLLTLAEWHASGRDTWYSGRFIERWADPRFMAALPAHYPTYDAASLRQALLALLDTVNWLVSETAAKFGYSYPAEAHKRIMDMVTATVAGAD